MIPIKIRCTCGQKFAFDVEPVGDRVPSPVACPSCGLDATHIANAQVRRQLTPPAAPAPAPQKKNKTLLIVGLSIAVVVMLGLAGGVYWWLKPKAATTTATTTRTTTVAPPPKVVRDPSFVAVGAMFDRDLKTRHVEITRVLRNSPAAKAGIVAGDILIKVDGEWIQDLRLKEIVEMVFGPVGTKVTLELIKADTGVTNRVELVREKFSTRTP